MASMLEVALFVGVLAGHTLLAAVMTRIFRIRLESTAGWVLFSAFLIPVVLFVSTLVFSGALQIGIDLGSPAVAFGVMIALPLALGFTIDVLYVPPPAEIDLPETTGR
ncbi:MAG: hypothetical protein ACQETB_01755 [Halobacteriota archaeon]